MVRSKQSPKYSVGDLPAVGPKGLKGEGKRLSEWLRKRGCAYPGMMSRKRKAKQ